MYFKERLLDFFDRRVRRKAQLSPATCLAWAEDILEVPRSEMRCEMQGFNYLVVIGSDRTVLRFPRHRIAARELQIETRFLAHFAPMSPVPVPQVTVHTHLPSGKAYARYPYIAGVPLTVQSYRQLDHAAQTAIARQIGQFLSALHSFPQDAARDAGVPTRNSVRDERRNQHMVERFVYPLLQDGQRAWVEAAFRDWCSLAQHTHIESAVVHADFRDEHVLVNHGALSGVIDFGDIEIGDPALDLSFLLVYGEDFVRRVLDHYTLPHGGEFPLRMRSYTHLRQVVVPAYLFMRGRGEEAAGMVRDLPAYIKQNPL